MGVKISDLPASAGAALAMQFEVNNAGTSERLTLAQMFALSTGAVVADTPLLNFAQTWNNAAVAFTALKLNITDSASASGSLLMDLRVGGVSQFKLDKAGWLYASVLTGVAGAFTAVHFGSTTSLATIDQAGVTVRDTYSFAWAIGANAANGSKDLFLWRDAAGTLAVRDGANAQTFRLYNTFTDASNYERGGLTWNTNRLFISTENAGSGAARSIRVVAASELELGSANADRWRLSSAGHLLAQADNSYDIGALGATRPRAIYSAGQVSANSFWLAAGGSGYWDADFLGLRDTGRFQFSATSNASGAGDVILLRDAANTLALRNGTNAQTFNLYSTYTDASNYERFGIRFASSIWQIGPEKLGTGITRALQFIVSGGDQIYLDGTSVRLNNHLKFATDNALDIGASGANRPRNIFAAGTIKGTLAVNNTAVAETPTATHTLILYDDVGNGYRVLAAEIP